MLYFEQYRNQTSGNNLLSTEWRSRKPGLSSVGDTPSSPDFLKLDDLDPTGVIKASDGVHRSLPLLSPFLFVVDP